MKDSVFKLRVRRLKSKLGSELPDALWITRPENRRYLSGYTAEDPQMDESAGSLLIWKRGAVLITDTRYTIQAHKQARGFRIVTMKNGIINTILRILKRTNVESIGFEEDHLTYGLIRTFRRQLRSFPKKIKLKGVNNIVESFRIIKDSSEIGHIKKAIRIISSVLDEVIQSISPGMSEKEIARKIETLALDAGAEAMSFPPIVAGGPNGAMPHAVPTDRKIKTGEPVIIDAGVRVNGYCSDMTRTLFIGSPKREFKRIYALVRKAQIEGIKAIKEGVMSDEPDRVARNIIKKAGLGDRFNHTLGHGVGLAVHEGPRLGPGKGIMLKEGMVVTVEPGIYLPGRGGVRLEEMVLITKDGSKVLTPQIGIYDF